MESVRTAAAGLDLRTRRSLRVVIVDDTAVRADGLHALLVGDPRINEVRTILIRSGLLIERASFPKVTAVVLIDCERERRVQLVEVTLRYAPQASVVVTGVGQDHAILLGCARAGAKGYVARDADACALLETIVRVADGQIVCPSAVAQALVLAVQEEGSRIAASQLPPLTRREAEIARMLYDGLTAKEIAKNLYLQPQTVKNHTMKLFRKLGVHSRLELCTALSRCSDHGSSEGAGVDVHVTAG